MANRELALVAIEHFQRLGFLTGQGVHLGQVHLRVLALDKDRLPVAAVNAQLRLEHPDLIARLAPPLALLLQVDHEQRHYPAVRGGAYSTLQQHLRMIRVQRKRRNTGVSQRQGHNGSNDRHTLPHVGGAAVLFDLRCTFTRRYCPQSASTTILVTSVATTKLRPIDEGK